ncbi:MAG: 1-aminocyclopropane-1-carboxylate deaminase/D-cysteine desulfhydrase [Bacteroidota bacterium]
MLPHPQHIPIQKVIFPDSENSNVSVLRLDTIDTFLGGNKYFKLLFNIDEIKKDIHQTIITFGGAYSNHLAAFATLKKQFPDKRFIAIVRGDESMIDNSNTLQRLQNLNIEIQFVHAGLYRDLCNNINHEYFQSYTKHLILPEGGSNDLAVKGCQTITDFIPSDFNQLVLPIATGATMAGIIQGKKMHQFVHGIAVLKGKDFLEKEIEAFLSNDEKENQIEYKIHDGFHHGGYAKTTKELLEFVKSFNNINDFEIEPIYTGKMFYALSKWQSSEMFASTDAILTMHTGGLQYLSSH